MGNGMKLYEATTLRRGMMDGRCIVVGDNLRFALTAETCAQGRDR